MAKSNNKGESEVDMIYPIFDSTWIIPVHVVPKKGVMTIISKEKSEVIPTSIIIG